MVKLCRLIGLAFLLLVAGCQEQNTTSSPGELVEPGQNSLNRAADATIPVVELVDAFPGLSFQQPVELIAPGDGSNRLFVVEKAGRIYVIEKNPSAGSARLFLDISDRVDSNASEKGLLGMAFHSDFARNQIFYVNYTDQSETVVARYQANDQTPQTGRPDSEQVVLTIPQPFANHNGGCIAFGPDGLLYIATGDGGSAGDPRGNAQNRSSLLGKILRIDVNGSSPGAGYGIPGDNPFVGNNNGYRPEIFAYGLRNPWKFSFDDEGRLWAADVGQNTMEEVDIVRKGLNYGWNLMEGSLCYPASSNCNREGLEMPIWEYRRPLGSSITGGYVYQSSSLPALHNAYIYGDFVSGRIWALYSDGPAPVNVELVHSSYNISSFGIDQNNELYIVDLGGKIYKLQPAA